MAYTLVFFSKLVQPEPDIVEVIELRQTLAIVRELVLILEIECNALRGALVFAREPLEHAFLGCHSRVVLTEPAIDDASRTILLLQLFQERFLPLKRSKHIISFAQASSV